MKTLFRKILGASGEDSAVRYLKDKGYKIIEKNFVSKFGEVDIIAESAEYLIFVEVKTRSSSKFGDGVSAVDRRKINKIIKTAEFYLIKSESSKLIRFDIISIDSGVINHIENAFTLE